MDFVDNLMLYLMGLILEFSRRVNEAKTQIYNMKIQKFRLSALKHGIRFFLVTFVISVKKLHCITYFPNLID